MVKSLRIALAQYALGPDEGVNLTTALSFMEQAKRAQARLVLYPELCLNLFFPQFAAQPAEHFALSLHDEPIKALERKARELELIACPNVYLRENGRYFDASLVIDPDGTIQGISKMVHIAQCPGFYERDYYTPSDTGFRVYETAIGTFGVVVCFDRHYPESIRTCALRGAEVILVPTANTIAEPLDIFECEVRTAAFQNGVYIAMCNRVGRENATTFAGQSLVVDPHGRLIAAVYAAKALEPLAAPCKAPAGATFNAERTTAVKPMSRREAMVPATGLMGPELPRAGTVRTQLSRGWNLSRSAPRAQRSRTLSLPAAIQIAPGETVDFVMSTPYAASWRRSLPALYAGNEDLCVAVGTGLPP